MGPRRASDGRVEVGRPASAAKRLWRGLAGALRREGGRGEAPRQVTMDRVLDAQADAFARLLALSPNDPDAAFRKAAELANGLFPHQIEGVAFLLGRTRAILADDMGLGKTRQAIVALRHIAPDGPYLVVCPASVKRNWAREIAIADPRATTHVVEKGTARDGAIRNG